MSTRDDASLTARERAALATLEASAAAEDPQLARRLRGSNPFRLLRRIRVPAWFWASWFGVPLTIVGLLLMVLSMSAGLVVGLVGAAVATGGMRMLMGAWQRRRNGPRPASL
jgi:hypothetical protein